MTMFSFHPVKHITTGEGGVITSGVITTNNQYYYQRLRDFRNHGIVRESDRLKDFPGPGFRKRY